MTSSASQKNKELSDKENPPHPSLGNKKLSITDELPTKKTVLGDSSHVYVLEEEE